MLADVSERYRRTTMATLRVGFLSGSVLELAATLGVALVAVTVGVRLVGGSLSLRGRADGARARARALPAAATAGDAVPRECGRPRSRRAAARAARRASGGHRRRSPGAAEPSRGPGSPGVGLVRLPVATGKRSRPVRARAAPRRDGRARRPERRGQDDGRKPAAALRGADVRTRERGRDRSRRVPNGAVATADRVGAAAADDLPRHRRRQHPARQRARATSARSGTRRCSPGPTASSRRCPPATGRGSATAVARSRPANAAGSLSPGPSCATRRS